ncbi:MAG: hypothetical protein HY865_22315 [Chloroflexi bacterium]|nr:hypothetical protein [Chloroflexota bacterium]
MKKSHLLINEPPLQVLPSLAVAIGLNEAIITQQLHYWLENKAVKGEVDENGNKWIFNTYEEWQENFPFWSIPTIKRAFLRLEDIGIVIAAQLNAKKRDMRKYYRIDYDKLCTLHEIKLIQSDESKLTPSSGSNLDDVKEESETTSETTKDYLGAPAPKERTPKGNGASATPPPAWGVEWQLAADVETVTLPTEEEQQNAKIANAVEMFPQEHKELVRAFVAATGIFPLKQDIAGWCSAFRDQKARTGLAPENIARACAKMFAEGLTIKDPFSVVGVAGSLRAADAQKPPRIVPKTIPVDDWRKQIRL